MWRRGIGPMSGQPSQTADGTEQNQETSVAHGVRWFASSLTPTLAPPIILESVPIFTIGAGSYRRALDRER